MPTLVPADDNSPSDFDDAFDDEQDTPDDELDDEFPLGDGTAETSQTIYCPHCAEPVELTLDPGGGREQEYVEDCEVCCRPWRLVVTYDSMGAADVTVVSLDD